MAPTPAWVKDLKPSTPHGQKTLKTERANSKLNVNQLSDFIYGPGVVKRKNEIEAILRAEPAFDKSQTYFDGRIDRFKKALAKEKRLVQLENDLKWTVQDKYLASALIGEPGPYGLHKSMFVVSIISFTLFRILATH
jgi:acyl-CoA oxidase